MDHPRRLGAAPTAIAVAVVAAGVGFGAPVGLAAPPADDGLGPQNRQRLAEFQFDEHLLHVASLDAIATDCTAPPADDLDADLACLAWVGPGATVGAIASWVAPKGYRFTAFDKLDASELNSTPAVANQAVLAEIDAFVATADGLGEYLTTTHEHITDLESVSWHAPTATLSMVVRTTATSIDDRDQAAFDVTNIVAYLWEADRPIRDPAASIHPRLEVTVDGAIYGTPYPVMIEVADFTMSFGDWLAITTTGGSSVRAR